MTTLPSFQGDRPYSGRAGTTHDDTMAMRAPLPFLGQRGRRLRSPAGRLVPSLLFLFGLSLCYLLVSSFVTLPPALCVRQECRMSRMWPSYTLHQPPSPSGQGSKYRLYLYKEHPPTQASTEGREIQRRPALFIHGNAGSYGQVRSVASWSWHDLQRQLDTPQDANGAITELDWWTVDFNEDFSAFHAATLEGQAVYVNEVLSYLIDMYARDGQPPVADFNIPILAHSMGGIVARLAIVKEGHPALSSGIGPVRTLVTLSTPHTVPPAPIEAAMDQIYDLINQDPTAQARQKDVLLVSLSGGILDTQLPSEYAAFPDRWSNQAIQAFTSNLPALWSSVDHLAMMWCDQLRRRIATAFGPSLGDADPSLRQRALRWRKALGVQAPGAKTTIDEWTEGAPDIILDTATEGLVSFTRSQERFDQEEFQLLTSFPIGQTVNGESLDVFVCRDKPQGNATERLCKPLPPWSFELLPPSPQPKAGEDWSDFPRAQEHYEAQGIGLRLLRVGAKTLAEASWDSLIIANQKPPGLQSHFWWTAHWGKKEIRLKGERKQGSLVFDLRGPEGSVSAFRLTHIDSSLFVYDFSFQDECPPGTSGSSEPLHQSRFAPMLHVQHVGTGDGRWYPSLPADTGVTIPVSIHATSPYLSVPPSHLRGLWIELFSDDGGAAGKRQCRPFASLTARINWRKSIGAWLARYRIAPVAWMTAVFALLAQIIVAEQVNTASTASTGRTLFLRLPAVASGIPLGFSFIFAGAVVKRFLIAFGLEAEGAYPKFARDLLFGLTGESAASFGFLSTDLGMSILLGIGTLAIAWTLLNVIFATLHLWTSAVAYIAKVLRLGKLLAFEHNAGAAANSRAERPRWRIGTTLFLAVVLLAVKVAVPYQVVFLAATLVQLLNVVRAKVAVAKPALDKARGSAASSKTMERVNAQAEETRLNQQLLVLLHLVILLPLRAPSLFIFVRNAIAGFATLPLHGRPGTVGLGFGEDHDVYRLAPVLLLVQVTSTGRLLELPQTWPWMSEHAREGPSDRNLWRSSRPLSPGKLMRGAYILLAAYTIAWGGRYPYRMYDLSLVIFTLTLVAHYVCRWRNPSAASKLSRLSGQDDDGEQGEAIALVPGDATSSRSHGHRKSQSLSDAEVLPFSIPDDLLDAEAAQPLASAHQPPAPSSEGGAGQNAAEESEIALPEGSHSTLDGDGNQGSGAIPAPPNPTASKDELFTLLTRYLEVLDAYLALRATLSQTLSQGHISLSAASMGSGGWGFDSANPLLARRRLLLRETEELRREVEVQIATEPGEEEKTILQLVDVEPPQAEEAGEEAQDDMNTLAKDGATASTALAQPSGSDEKGLRRRRQEGAPSQDATPSKPSETASRNDEKGKVSAEKSEQEEQEPKRPAVPPSVLHRLSPLPSANLRRAQERFRQALGCIVGAGQDGQAEGAAKAKEKVEAQEGKGEIGGQRQQLGLVPLLLEMGTLEEKIRQARRDLSGRKRTDGAA